MLETFLSAGVLERLINSALRLDPAARDKLAALNGRRISLDHGWREQPWIVEIRDGSLALSDDHATLCDVRLSGNLSGFLQLFKKPAAAAGAPRGKLYIEGDLHAAQQFQRVMGELAPDFDSVLRERFGEPLGTFLADSARRLQAHGEAGKAALEAKLRDYLGKNGCADRSEAADFARRVAALRQRISQLENRLDTRPNRGERAQ